MKTYAIQNGNEYIIDGHRLLNRRWRAKNHIMSTEIPDDAKHWDDPKKAKTILKANITRVKNYIEKDKEAIVAYKNTNNWRLHSAQEALTKNRSTLTWLNGAQVVEVDVEHPNLDADEKILWDKWRLGNGTAGQSHMTFHKDIKGKSHCKACGLRLKNIPYYELNEGNPTKICIPCLYMRMANIKSAFESMPESFRTRIINELMLRNL